MTRRLVVLGAWLALVGCSSTPTPRAEGRVAAPARSSGGESTAQTTVEANPERLQVLEDESAARARRIRELESRLALRDAQVRELQDAAEARALSEAAGGSELAPAPVLEATPVEEEAEPEEGPRVVLRLYGPPTPPPEPPMASSGVAPATSAPLYLPAPPPGALGRLPVMATAGAGVPPIPDQPSYVAPSTTMPAPSVPDGSVQEYQAALQHVSARRFPEALRALTEFLAAHPAHPYADNAMYWRAEVYYARRDYLSAERELNAMIARFPQGNKVADALLRLGSCRQRQGDADGARQYYRRVIAEFPNTVAARLASREDT